LRENVLYLSEDDFEGGFSAQRALSRNRVIHALGIITFVAQSSLEAGGTWDGTVKNLQNRWSDVYGFNDDSEAINELSQRGLERIGMKDLADFYDLPKSNTLI
jgi:predicted Rossmann fold nucleotide-binding protein DprA/Smf involved in DNA uptake